VGTLKMQANNSHAAQLLDQQQERRSSSTLEAWKAEGCRCITRDRAGTQLSHSHSWVQNRESPQRMGKQAQVQQSRGKDMWHPGYRLQHQLSPWSSPREVGGMSQQYMAGGAHQYSRSPGLVGNGSLQEPLAGAGVSNAWSPVVLASTEE
jgi:hypothetical protein